jgi:hypothetical protein
LYCTIASLYSRGDSTCCEYVLVNRHMVMGSIALAYCPGPSMLKTSYIMIVSCMTTYAERRQ